ncbi:DUF917 domain-containing protein [Nocardioides ginsengisoli]|uniref:DUF917 domain-containing protein n=1 Tax=Nocardioides ginsengisoli TaxID=363868 RepID=A0ABW3W7W8_9ACTN
MRRRLSERDIEAIAEGSAILGTGGGGDPYLGSRFACRAIREHGEPELVSVDELPDDALAVAAAVVGSPVPMMEKLSLGEELGRAFDGMQEAMGRPITAMMSPEIGGVNTVVSIALAAERGLPVVDADSMGRAFPEVQLVTQTIHGIGVSPMSMADEHGNVVIMKAVDNFWTERLARSTVIQFGAIAPALAFPLTKEQIELASVHGSVSLARDIGEILLERSGEDALRAVLDRTGGVELFAGKISGVDRHVTGGWAVGEVHIEGADAFAGATMRVTFQNENLMAYVGDEPMACVPDLLTIVEQDSCRGITTERLRFGSRVSVLAMPCDEQWLSPRGLEIAGPRHFGYDVDYRPFEGRRPSPALLAARG